MDVLPSSDIKAWWRCAQGHEWQTQIKVRSKGGGCPYCSGRVAIIGQNDLKTVNPMLAEEWNYERNGHSLPEHFLPNSGKKVWWRCKEGHEWIAQVKSRTKGTGCPYCAGRRVLKGYNDLATANAALAAEWDHEKNGNLTPNNFTANSSTKVWWKCSQGHQWQATIANRNYGTGCPICSNKRILIGYNDLKTLNPTIANEWNYGKNGDLKPESFAPNSGITV